jgi:hypothetical protein
MPGDADRFYAEYDSTRTAQAGTHVTAALAAGDTTTVDLTDPGMPWLGQSYFNAATHSAGWTQTDGTYDAAIATSNWSHFDGKVSTFYYWTVVAPPGVTGWTWNDPPAALADYLPADTDFVNGDVTLIDLATAADYDELRGQPEWLMYCPTCDTHDGTVAGTSSEAYSYSSGEGFAAHQRTMRPALRNHR